MIRTKKIIWLSIGVSAILLMLIFYFITTDSSEVKYSVVEVKRADISKAVLAAGVAVPIRKVDVGAQVSGQIQTLHVALGQSVKSGQLLAEIDPTLAQTSLQQEMAMLEQQEATLSVREIDLAAAKREVAKQHLMLASDATTGDEVERATDQFERSKAELRSVQAQVKQTKALISSSSAKLAYTKIIAPIDGKVINILVQQGQTVNAVQQVPSVLTLAQMDRMTIRAKVPEADISRLKVGQKLIFNPLGNPGSKNVASLQALQPFPERINGALFYNALFDVANTDNSLWPEMTVQVAFITSERKNVLILPWTALSKKNGEDKYVVDLVDEKARRYSRDILIGIDDGVNVEIRHGLQLGDKVALP